MNALERAEQIAAEGFDFRFGDYFSHGLSIMKKNLGGFVVFALVAGLITMIVNFIPFIGSLVNSFLLTPVLIAGLYLVARKVDLGLEEDPPFREYFSGFDQVKEIVLVSVTTTVITLVALIPWAIAMSSYGLVDWYTEFLSDPGSVGTITDVPDLPVWSFILLLPVIFVGVALNWSILFVIFFEGTFLDAVKASYKLIVSKWFSFLGFFIVVGIFAVIGVVALLVGILFTFPAAMCVQYAAFSEITRLEEGNMEGDILDHLVD